jgi:hypothetical protein
MRDRRETCAKDRKGNPETLRLSGKRKEEAGRKTRK